MANARQRRKARSSTYKPVSQSLRSKKNMKKGKRACVNNDDNDNITK